MTSPWPAAGQRAALCRDRGIYAGSEFGIPIATGRATATVDTVRRAVAAATACKLFLPRGFIRTSTRLFVHAVTDVQVEGINDTHLVLNTTGLNVAASDVLLKDLTIIRADPATSMLFAGLAAGGRELARRERAVPRPECPRMARLGAAQRSGVASATGSGMDAFVESDHCEATGAKSDGGAWP